MPDSLLKTKLYAPQKRPYLVPRPRLIERLNQGLHLGHKLTLISAPAGFGKTTLVSEWLQDLDQAASPIAIAWLSLDNEDNDPTRFLAYFIAALQTIVPNLGEGVLAALQSPQPPPIDSILTNLLNEIAAVPDNVVLVLDDYHLIEANPIDKALAFLLQHLPPQKHLVITTREDPNLPLARFRARNQLTELRATDLRFALAETAVFLNQVMDLNLSRDDIDALETRTEGWIAGLQLAALALQGHLAQQETAPRQRHKEAASFIQSFTGSHHFVLDYLVEEVLHQLPASIQNFLLRTSILERMCGPLCDAVVETEGNAESSSQEILEYLEQANLFIVPLDNERRWYRYHHLFAELLRQRVQQREKVNDLHIRASQWYEENDLEIEAFQHAAAANDIKRAERLIAGKGMPLHFRGAITPVLKWLASLPTAVLNTRPSLWVTYASALSMTGQGTATEEKLQAAEKALQDAEETDQTRNLIGHIAAIRALLAASQYDTETIISQSERALEYLHPNNLPVRTATTWKLGLAYQYEGNRAAARQAFGEAIASSQATGNLIINVAATSGLGNIQEVDNQLHQAAESYRRVLQLVGATAQHTTVEAHRGLARIQYQWNDLDAAQEHGQKSAQLAQQFEKSDTFVACKLFLARLKLVQGDVAGATAQLAESAQAARQHNFVRELLEITAVQIVALLRQGDVATAADLAQTHDLPLSQVRVHLAQGEPAKALALLVPVRQQAEARKWPDEQLKVMVLQALALQAQGETDQVMQLLGDALALAEPGGFIRLFVDEGQPMAQLLSTASAQGIRPSYTEKLLAAFKDEEKNQPVSPPAQPLIEPLSEREIEVLQLVAEGLSNHEIGEQLYLALNTVKGHNRRIFAKLQVQRRTEAVARARELGLLSL